MGEGQEAAPISQADASPTTNVPKQRRYQSELVLDLILLGLSKQEIADRFGISTPAVYKQIEKLKEEYAVESLLTLVAEKYREQRFLADSLAERLSLTHADREGLVWLFRAHDRLAVEKAVDAIVDEYRGT